MGRLVAPSRDSPRVVSGPTTGSAMVSTLEAEQSFTTLDLTAKHFKPCGKSR